MTNILAQDVFWYGVITGMLATVTLAIVLVALIHHRINESERDLEHGQDR